MLFYRRQFKAKLPPEARQYLHGIFMDMIDKYPRH